MVVCRANAGILCLWIKYDNWFYLKSKHSSPRVFEKRLNDTGEIVIIIPLIDGKEDLQVCVICVF